MIDVKQPPYSAVGDGVTDDTQAIQNAINAAQAGEVIMLSSGKYLCGPLVGRSDRPLLLTGTVGAQIIAKPNTRTSSNLSARRSRRCNRFSRLAVSG